MLASIINTDETDLMFPLNFRRKTDASQIPVVPQVQKESNSTETLSSGCKMQNETVDAGDQQPANKYERFELESENLGNPWAFPFAQAV